MALIEPIVQYASSPTSAKQLLISFPPVEIVFILKSARIYRAFTPFVTTVIFVLEIRKGISLNALVEASKKIISLSFIYSTAFCAITVLALLCSYSRIRKGILFFEIAVSSSTAPP